MTGLSPKLELFAREQVSGWDAMGYDIDGKDIRVALALCLAIEQLIDKKVRS